MRSEISHQENSCFPCDQVKDKGTHFTSVSRTVQCTSSDKPEADTSAFILAPLSIRAPFLRVFKATLSYTESRNKDFRSHLGIELRASRTEGRTLTNCANFFPSDVDCYLAKQTTIGLN